MVRKCEKMQEAFYLIPAFAVMIFCWLFKIKADRLKMLIMNTVITCLIMMQPQYYMSNSSAAAPSRYYFIGDAAISTGSERFLYYFDMVNKSVMPLCTKS